MSDDVLDLLESIDETPKGKPKKTRKGKAKGANEDIMGFLDELSKNGDNKTADTSKEPTPAATAPVESPASTHEEASPQKAGQSLDQDEEFAATGRRGYSFAEGGPTMPDAIASISSWWTKNKGGIWDTATSAATVAASRAQGALKQAEERVKELQGEELQSFNIKQLQSRLGSVLRTIVPPISRHEQLRLHIFHDMVGFPNVDQMVHHVFERVMDQVEGGGDLNMIVQKGKERHKAGSDTETQKCLHALHGSVEEGKKLAIASVEDYIRSVPVEKNNGGPEEARVSEVFVAIQPVLSDATGVQSPDNSDITVGNDSLCFLIYLTDPEQKISLCTTSQPFPSEWAKWLDAPEETYKGVPVDPREWALEWIEEGLSVAVGVVAEKYVTLRMGLSEVFAEGK